MIAVILMVAITVVLAATVYVWVSGFGSNSSTAAKSVSMTSAGPVASNTKSYVIAAAVSGMKWSDVALTLNGAPMTYDSALGSAATYCVATAGSACVATGSWTPSTLVMAGQTIQVHDTALTGKTLRVLDSAANAVMMTLVVG